MFKAKQFKFLLFFISIILVITITSWNFTISAAISSDFKQLDYTSLLSEMGTGWNLGNSLESITNETPSEIAWGNPVITKSLITKVKEAGFDTIRIPVSYFSKIGNSPDYTIDSDWLDRIQEVVDYAYSQDMYVIINMHGDGYTTIEGSWLLVNAANQETIKDKYQKVWTQIANRFVDYDEHLILESMNEEFDGDYGIPNKTYYENLNAYNQIFVDAVRKTGGNNSARWLLIPGWNTNIDYTTGDYGFIIPSDNYRSSDIPSDEKRIAISVHYYSPWDFCGDSSSQITQWGENATDASRTSSWGQEDYMESQLYDMYEKFVTKGYPFILGEYGVIDKTSVDSNSNTYRKEFITALNSKTKKYGGIPVYWDNGYNGAFGFAIFDRINETVTQQGIIDSIMNSINSTPAFDPDIEPKYETPEPLPDGSFSVFYDSQNSWSDGAVINVTITNNGEKFVTNWKLEFSFNENQEILDLWGGKFTQDGQNVVVTNTNWNGVLDSKGDSTTFGFKISFSGENTTPDSFTLNGSKCIIE